MVHSRRGRPPFKRNPLVLLVLENLYSVFLPGGRSGIVTNEPDPVDLIRNYTWHKSNDGYMATHVRIDGKQTTRKFHIVLMEKKDPAWANRDKTTDRREVDHINGDRLDNRVENLRLLSRRANAINRTKRRHKFGMAGINEHRDNGKVDYIYATWRIDGHAHAACFSIATYGYDGAVAMAKAARISGTKDLPEHKELAFRPPGYDPLKYRLAPQYLERCIDEPIQFLAEQIPE